MHSSHGIELKTICLFRDQLRKCRLSGSSSLCPALPGLTVEVVGGGIVESGFLFRYVRGLNEGVLDSSGIAQNTSNRLVVGVLGKLEQQRVEDGGLGLLIRLVVGLANAPGKLKSATYIQEELLLQALLALLFQKDVACGVDYQDLAIVSDDALLGALWA